MGRAAYGSWTAVVLLFLVAACTSTSNPPPGTGPRRLMQRPRAPSRAKLDAVVAELFPAMARAQNRNGRATVRVQIAATGQAGSFEVIEETGNFGFGPACIETLRRVGEWQPAIDETGQAASAEIEFTCVFTIDDCAQSPRPRSMPRRSPPTELDRAELMVIELRNTEGRRIGVLSGAKGTSDPATRSFRIVTLSLRVEADGSVGSLEVAAASEDPALGDACMKLASAVGPYEAARDPECQPIAASLQVACTFAIESEP